ncbi:hypothetical protein AQUCO_00900120v1 [Aquilegia coerulea]|uniref:Uncharacterized protein n=1 Tax=Aquilegia coerulea TaxID=218851 RepID=A0A2G5EC32_AQUCA|nr:hypothetical protein AQUCO_00900120v1 [Aquilegia coerulea]
MASAQILSNTEDVKQRQLEAGRRRLDEFRKNKAERARKSSSTAKQKSTDVSQNVAQTQESGSKRLLVSDGAATSERDNGSVNESFGIISTTDNKPIASSINIELGSSSRTHGSSLFPEGSHNTSYADTRLVKDPESKLYNGSELFDNFDRREEDKNRYDNANDGTQGTQTKETDQSIPLNVFHGIGYNDGNIYQSTNFPIGETHFKEDEGHLKGGSGTSHMSITSISSEKLSPAVQRNAGFTSTSASANTYSSYNEVGYSVPSSSILAESFPRAKQSNGVMNFDSGPTNISNSITQEPNANSAYWKPSDSLSSGFTSRNRNRTSFLDSLNVQRDPSVSSYSFTKSESSDPFLSRSSKGYSTDIQASSASGQSLTKNATIGSSDMLGTSHDMYDRGNYSVSMNNENGMLSQGVQDSAMKWSHEFPTAKQDENFSALEQHIEDLTQEKFSLTRALEASRALSESLAAENSSLTDSYNQQRNAVNQLKSEMESLQEEVKSQMLELDSFKMEYSNAQLECNAADERAKILASEVIVLEEKALKLRSRELKLERQLEEANAEIASYKKKVSSLQKERQDLQSTIDALQEEKKLLQSKVRKAAGNAKVEVVKTPSDVKNVSTSTEDLGFEDSNLVRDLYSDADTVESTSNHDMQHDAFPSSTSSTFQLLPEDRQFHFSVASAAIPHDQLRMIRNINSVISELALEKEELVQALTSESSHSSKLKVNAIEWSFVS